MLRCLKCKKYLEVWDGKPSHPTYRLGTDPVYADMSNYDYLIVDKYEPQGWWDKFTNLFRRKEWYLVGGILISAKDYATAYEDSTLEVVGLSGTGSPSYQGTHFICHAKDFASNKQAFIDSIPIGRKIQCTSCQHVFELAEAVKFWEQREQYYGDLPLCACGGEIMNDIESIPISYVDGKPTDDESVTINTMRTVFRCEDCETVYDRTKFGDEAVDLTDE